MMDESKMSSKFRRKSLKKSEIYHQYLSLFKFLRIFLVIGFGFAPLVSCAEIGKYFTKTPQSIVAPPGDRVIFECETNIPAEQVRWKLNGNFLSPATDSDIKITGSFLYVKLSNDRERFSKHVGDYQCVVEFGAEALTSVPAQLTLAQILPFPERKNESLEVVNGNLVGISCDAPYSNPGPIINFYKDGALIDSEIGNGVVSESGVLHLFNVSGADSGYYSCSSTNHITSEMYMATHGTILVVNSTQKSERKAPVFLIKPKAYNILPQDGNITLECVAVGNPPPFISWRKLRSATMTQYSTNNGSLHLFNTGLEQEGEYICEAYNGVGRAITTKSTIVLNSMPNITKEPVNLMVEEGGEAVLDCESGGLPKPKIYWIFNGHSVIDDENIKITDTYLKISKVEKKHAGLFQCFAYNPVGTVSSPAELKVLAKQISALSISNGERTEYEYPERGSSTTVTLAPVTRHHKNNNNKFHRGKHNKRRKYNKGQDVIPPSKPVLNRVSDNSVMARWSVPPNTGYPIQFFKVQYKEVSRGSGRWMTIDDDIPPHIHSFEITNLHLGRAYKFRIVAVYSNNDNKEGPNSERFLLQKEQLMRRPNLVPLVTTAAPNNSTSIILRWNNGRSDKNSGIDGFFIYYRESTSAGDFSKATVLGSEADTYYISHLKPGTAYNIKIQAFNKAGASNFSTINTAKTLGEAVVERGEDDEFGNKKEIEIIVPEDPPPTNDRLYVILGCLFAAFWILLCLTCALCYKCKQKRAEEDMNNKYNMPINVESKGMNNGHGHIMNGYIPTIASQLEFEDKETSFVERINNNRPLSPPSSQQFHSSRIDLELSSFNSSSIDIRSWTEMKPLKNDSNNHPNHTNSSSKNNSLRSSTSSKLKKKPNNAHPTTNSINNYNSISSGGGGKRGYVSCSSEELDKSGIISNENENSERDTKIFPKEHYRGSRRHSLSRKRNSMIEG